MGFLTLLELKVVMSILWTYNSTGDYAYAFEGLLKTPRYTLGVCVAWKTGTTSLFKHGEDQFESVVNKRSDGTIYGDVEELREFESEFQGISPVVRPVVEQIFGKMNYDDFLPLMRAPEIKDDTRKFCLARRLEGKVVIYGQDGLLRTIDPRELELPLEYIICNGSEPNNIINRVLNGRCRGAWILYDPKYDPERC